jgi:hypothetical protein
VRRTAGIRGPNPGVRRTAGIRVVVPSCWLSIIL